ncbi:type I-E CRISPR-associated protein Cse2/CasB [Xylanimonas oleitrophica]|uniref:Type I-E CRISPR-associated protein Cse2/CasB n=1 Tax=Xylanimonas oleitrophica TaxID=2607479 RepID=A0A2W5Y2C1_9MICO|nr:type I-E CRISPR-associated protein Cse2/CasB [Xylanimonas oleitrophica]PZR51714.1 type I-E CRISPR-associated protein Cse2/CasB [Xylanimonas oleitrophica]
MSESTTVAAEETVPPSARVRELVARRAASLQAKLHSDSRSAVAQARRDLARLRAGVGRAPGADPTTWALTVDGVPGVPDGDAPTPQERAVHLAMTLFGAHQQSREEGMHRPGVGVGQAVARLERKTGGQEQEGPSPVRRRFDAMITSGSLTELAHHLRGLVQRMRAEGEGLDYGMLAEDLLQFQRPGRADDVRRRWARQYYRLDRSEAADDQTTTPESTPETTAEEHP